MVTLWMRRWWEENGLWILTAWNLLLTWGLGILAWEAWAK